jgi:hypothetical protein
MRATAEMHQRARANATEAFTRAIGAPPTVDELRFLLAEALHDSTFGAGWHGDGAGSNNMGAVHAYPAWTGATFTYTDSHADGKRYTQTFKKYPTALDGWIDLVHEFYQRRSPIRAAAQSGDPQAVATAMVRTKYAEGFGDTEAEQIGGWARALSSALEEIDAQPGAVTASAPIPAEVWDPQYEPIGTTVLTEQNAPGVAALVAIYGPPVLIAYPNSWRFLWFGPGLQFRTKAGIPYTPKAAAGPVPKFGWEQAGVVLGIAGIAATIFVATLSPLRRRRSYA